MSVITSPGSTLHIGVTEEVTSSFKHYSTISILAVLVETTNQFYLLKTISSIDIEKRFKDDLS